ncbi:hypothetical protein GCM10007897_36820 [Sphingobium jiangsuense]|nr:tyrosine-type recombinase/integrase [Sphingobium jiangsuense]GLT02276.1 hypothetical protein GCM10007897_36820 [Sphingobium jiangsuense]
MAIRSKGMAYLKRVKARGKVYGYFDTGQKDDRGRRIYAPLGPISDPAFGAKYAAMLGHRTRRQSVSSLMSTAGLVDLYQKSQHYKKKSDGTRRVYDIYLNAFLRQLPTAPAGEVERRDVVTIIDKMADRPGAANLQLATIKALYAWGRERGHVTNDPCKDIGLMDVGEHQPWPEWLLDRALQADDATVRLAVHLLYYTAQRIGDVVKMRWADVDRGTISIRQQKTRKDMSIPIHQRLADEMDRVPRAGLFILMQATGKPFSPDRLRDIISAWVKAQTNERFIPHGLRKNAVNALLECGCSIAETSAISGQSLQVVEHYAKGRNQKRLADSAVIKWQGGRRTK